MITLRHSSFKMLTVPHVSGVAKLQTEGSQGYGDLWLQLLFLKWAVLEIHASWQPMGKTI